MRSAPKAHTDPLFDIPVEQLSNHYEIMYHGGGDFTQLICVVVRFDRVVAEDLLPLLSWVIASDTWGSDEDRWFDSTLRFISSGAKQLCPEGETVITWLAVILVVQMIRLWIDSVSDTGQGGLAVLRDEQAGRVLISIHRAGEELGHRIARLRSRHVAYGIFGEIHPLGRKADHVLCHRMMDAAGTHLRETSAPLSEIASRVGNDSEAAFCGAFKREFGVPPGHVRRDDQSGAASSIGSDGIGGGS